MMRACGFGCRFRAIGGLLMPTENSTQGRLTEGLVALADISGYTDFVRHRALSLQHAEMIVTELMGGIIDAVESPWVVNKLEGDAALVYAELPPTTQPDQVAVAIGSLSRLFDAFDSMRSRLTEERRNCGCGACTDLGRLRLKVLSHRGALVVKRVRQFEELAGDDVILLHRLAKNDVPVHEYLLLTEPVMQALASNPLPALPLPQQVDGWEQPVPIWYLSEPQRCRELLGLRRPAPRASSPAPGVRRRWFHHLPPGPHNRLRAWLEGLVLMFRRNVGPS